MATSAAAHPPDTPFMIAASSGDVQTLNDLINEGKEDPKFINEHGFSALVWASLKGHIDAVKLLIPLSDLNPSEAHTPIRGASLNGRIEVVEVLLKSGSEVDVRSMGGRTALMGAAMNGHKEIVELLIDNGADCTIKNSFGETALDLTKLDTIQDLLKQRTESAQA